MRERQCVHCMKKYRNDFSKNYFGETLVKVFCCYKPEWKKKNRGKDPLDKNGRFNIWTLDEPLGTGNNS